MSETPTAHVLLVSLLLPFSLLVSGREAQAQPGLDLENDTFTQSVLIHPPVDASADSLSLSTREASPGLILFEDNAHVREITVEKGETVQPR